MNCGNFVSNSVKGRPATDGGRAGIVFLAIFILLFQVVTFSGEAVCAEENIRPVEGISYSPLVQVVPGPGIPEEIELGGSNNNLDIARYQGKLFFAFRTAPTHFASRATKLVILSSTDGEKWEVENTIHMGRDMREPRFLVYKDKLFFYFFSSGKNPWTFNPQYIWVSIYESPGQWSDPQKVWKPGSVVWRLKEYNGYALMSSYTASGVMETKGDSPNELILLKSEDGLNWEPFDPDRPVQVYGGGEADFEFDDAGNLFTVVRNEGGATKVCGAPAANIAEWECTETPYKYDSPIMFKQDGEIYIIARRNIAGEFYRDRKAIPNGIEAWLNLGKYWVTRKRTAMYRFDTEKMLIEWLFDFPSRGDTSFPAMVRLNEKQWLLYNYSSPIDGPDRCWLGGQLTGTRIYSTVLTFGE